MAEVSIGMAAEAGSKEVMLTCLGLFRILMDLTGSCCLGQCPGPAC